MAKDSKKDMDIARKIWLAGIGAYGRAIGDAQEAYAKVGMGTTKVFEDLVGKGAELESTVSVAAKSLAPEIMKKQRETLEDRMDRMKAALGLAEVTAENAEQIEEIEAKLETIEAKLDQIIALLDKPKAKRQPAKKPTARGKAK